MSNYTNENENVTKNIGMILYGSSICPFCQRAKLAMLLAEENTTYREINFVNKPSWITEISPLGKVPILRTPNGVLFDSDVIVSYIDKKNKFLLSSDNILTQHKMLSWNKVIDSVHDTARQYFLTDNEEKYSHLAQKLRKAVTACFDGSLYEKLLQDNYRPIVDVYQLPLFFLLQILEKNGSNLIIEKSVSYRDKFVNSLQKNIVFGKKTEVDLLNFLCDRNSIFSKNAMRFI